MAGRCYVLISENGSTKNIRVIDQSITVHQFMRQIRQQLNILDNFVLYCGEQRLHPKAKLGDLNVGTMKNPIRVETINFSGFVSDQTREPFSNLLALPPLFSERETSQSKNSMIRNDHQPPQLPNRYSKLGSITSRTSSIMTPTPNSVTESAGQKLTEENDRDEDILQNEVIVSKYESDLETNNTDNYQDDETNGLDQVRTQTNFSSSESHQKPSSEQSSRDMLDAISHNNNNVNVERFEVRIRSLRRVYKLCLHESCTIKMLMHKLWDHLPSEEDQYTMDSHILLLFNHRLHTFVEESPHELVKDFIVLSPSSCETHFYLYGLPKEYKEHMYYCHTNHEDLLKELDAWNPAHFGSDILLERPLSILLSSFYALRSFFNCDDRTVAQSRKSMDTQFFIELRKYLYPPAVLALKHLLDGVMFVFEQTLLADSLFQLLEKLCPTKFCGIEVSTLEYFDFIPILICWILDEWDPDRIDDNYFRLINRRASQNNSIPIGIDTVDGEVSPGRDVDTRCLHRHLTRAALKNERMIEFYNRYKIYDPDEDSVWDLTRVKSWSEQEISSIYETMKHRYRTFRVFTRDAITSNVTNQLILLEHERTVSVLLGKSSDGVNIHDQDDSIINFIEMFNPLDKKNNIVKIPIQAVIEGKTNFPDPRLPRYFSSYLITEPINTSPSEPKMFKPAEQVTIILLDLSKSMFNCSISCDGSDTSYSHIERCNALLNRLSDNMSPKRDSHAFGLIEYGDDVHIKCPITRNRDKFDSALKSYSPRGNWTCLYDAVSKAATKIESYVKSPIRAVRQCKKLIICLSDGMNNAGHTSVETLQRRILERNIIVDSISFLPDDEIHDKKKLNAVNEFREFCSKSGGYIYSKLWSRSTIELASLFEQEATFWLSKRASDSSGIVEMPKTYFNPIFYKEAVLQPEPHEHQTDSSESMDRIWREFKTIQQLELQDFVVYMVVDSASHWKVILKGPEQTVYANKFWMLFVEFDSSYPEFPPHVRFITPIYHMNISGDGKIFHEILDRCWTKKTTMIRVFKSIIEILEKPNFQEAFSREKADLFQENALEYERQAKEHTELYAKDSIETFIEEYHLLDTHSN